MLPYSVSQEELLRELEVSPQTGLSAGEVQKRLERYGENKLPQGKKKTMLRRFLEQFQDVMILILLAAAAVSFGVACFGHDPLEFFEPLLILVIVVLNAVLGVAQESRAEKALDALKDLSAPHARVIREGKEQVIDAAQLVPGDVIRLEAGDCIPADARMLKSVSLKSEESALTGESVPSEKDADAQISQEAPLGDRANMVFSGCSITYGTALAVVTATGTGTEMGKIAGLLEGAEDTQTPLQRKLAKLGTYLGFVALGACAVIFVVGLLNGIPPLDIFMTAVSLAVSAIPEGLPAIVTIVLAIGVQRMVKRNALIRSLPAVETLGSASVICSDKTGTLTFGKPQVVQVESLDESLSPSQLYTWAAGAELRSEHPLGKAIVRCFQEVEHTQAPEPEEFQMLPGRGVKATVQGAQVLAGNPELLQEEGVFLSEEAKSAAGQYLSQGCTVVYLAGNGRLAGFIALADTLRPDTSDTIAQVKAAGVIPVLLTGDHPEAAQNIASQLSLTEVKANCLPQDKLQYIGDCQERKEPVCMIGDGINDAPALKMAQVGVAMGGIGSDIAVDAADIALVNDDIREIPHLLRLSKRMMMVIKCNLTFSMVLNFLAIILAMTGILNPVVGALVHNAGSVFVIIHSAFLLRWKTGK